MAKTTRDGADLIAVATALSDEELGTRLDALFAQKASIEGSIVVLLGEVARRQSYRADGATGPEAWAAERFGVSVPTARALTALAETAWDLPRLVGSLCAGELSLDKMRAIGPVATPESDEALAEQAKECSVRELAEVARRTAATVAPPTRERRTVRFNDHCRSVSIQLPAVPYAETRACLEARARALPADPAMETPFDERLGEAFVELIRASNTGRTPTSADAASASSYVVVAHVPLAALVDESGETSTLAGELERDGLIDVETVRELACDATLVVALDDDVGHTMYEGRARREPNAAQRREVLRRDRHCRFPGCVHVSFTHVHHVVPWKPDGRTDLDNLALLCVHHHHLMHSKAWTMDGNANEELRFVGPSGRVMTSRPSPLWTSA